MTSFRRWTRKTALEGAWHDSVNQLTVDQVTLLVLETLQRLVGTAEDISSGWFFPITISKATGLDIEDVVDEYDILNANGLIELRERPDKDRKGRLAILTPRGAATLAEGRKHRRALERTTERAEEPTFDRLVVRTKSSDRAYDVFLSYASEDRQYAVSLKQALNEANVSVWIDVEEVSLGEPILPAIERGIKESRYAVLLLSPSYTAKSWPKVEFDALMKRQIDARGGPGILPLLHGGLSQEQLAEFSPTIGTLRNTTTDRSLLHVVEEILRVVEPPSLTVATPLSSASAQGSSEGAPNDALPDDVRLLQFRPRLNLSRFEWNQESPKKLIMKYVVDNVGKGSASKISTFLPGVLNERLPGPIAAESGMPIQVVLSARKAYFEVVPTYAQAVVEFEDQAGNLYRQYGRPVQHQTPHGRYKYEVEELDRPYLVPQRIIPEDHGRGFNLEPEA